MARKIPRNTIRCLGQDQDSGEECPDHCPRWIDVTQEPTDDDVRIVSMMRESAEVECKKRIEK